MDISCVDLFYEDEVEEEYVNVSNLRKKIRDASNPLELPSAKFISYFRLNKEAFCYLLDEVKDKFNESVRVTSIPPILKLCAALRFFADGSYQKCSGNDFNVGMAQPTASKAIKEVLNVLSEVICAKWIKTRMTEEKKHESKVWFYTKSGFPGVLGCIDGTHVRIVAPRKDVQHLYLNRKGYYSLNVMILCDYQMNIRFVDARHPGANHDSLIFNVSDLKPYLESNSEENSWILGDAGYPLRPYLMTPFRMTSSGSPEARYNTAHAKGRNIVERTIGVLKSRFRCLLSARGLHYAPEKAKKIVNVCCALHNITQHYKVQLQEETTFANTEGTTPQASHVEEDNTEVARSIKNSIMRSF